jgi:hypothetical protein
MKEAIEILEKRIAELEYCKGAVAESDIHFTIRDIEQKQEELESLKFFFKPKHTWQPSPDTDYKIALTKWIEGKHQAENPYSVFEEWQKSNNALAKELVEKPRRCMQ